MRSTALGSSSAGPEKGSGSKAQDIPLLRQMVAPEGEGQRTPESVCKGGKPASAPLRVSLPRPSTQSNEKAGEWGDGRMSAAQTAKSGVAADNTGGCELMGKTEGQKLRQYGEERSPSPWCQTEASFQLRGKNPSGWSHYSFHIQIFNYIYVYIYIQI